MLWRCSDYSLARGACPFVLDRRFVARVPVILRYNALEDKAIQNGMAGEVQAGVLADQFQQANPPPNHHPTGFDT